MSFRTPSTKSPSSVALPRAELGYTAISYSDDSYCEVRPLLWPEFKLFPVLIGAEGTLVAIIYYWNIVGLARFAEDGRDACRD